MVKVVGLFGLVALMFVIGYIIGKLEGRKKNDKGAG